ncbi:MAG: hypothetical protein Q4A49_04885 [Neisseria sp.]|nr:hypothetical protein [Neisseria sp.]
MASTKIADIIVPEVFTRYSISRTKEKSALFSSGIISELPEAQLLAQRGGTLINMPFWKDLTGTSEVLSDSKSLTVNNIRAASDIAVLHARGKAWGANDLAQALSGDDPLNAVTDLTSEYWNREMQRILLSSLKGVFTVAEMVSNRRRAVCIIYRRAWRI